MNKRLIPQMDEQQIMTIIKKMVEFADDDAKAMLAKHLYILNAEYGSAAVSRFATAFFKAQEAQEAA